jgi:hypothetical protein
MDRNDLDVQQFGRRQRGANILGQADVIAKHGASVVIRLFDLCAGETERGIWAMHRADCWRSQKTWNSPSWSNIRRKLSQVSEDGLYYFGRSKYK